MTDLQTFIHIVLHVVDTQTLFLLTSLSPHAEPFHTLPPHLQAIRQMNPIMEYKLGCVWVPALTVDLYSVVGLTWVSMWWSNLVDNDLLPLNMDGP